MNDPIKPVGLNWRDDVARRQQDLGLKPDPVPGRVTTITAPGEARGASLVRDALNPQNLAANRAEAMPFANQVSGPRFAPDGTGRRQGGAATPPLLARPDVAAAAPAAVAAPTIASAGMKPAAPAPAPASAPARSGAPGMQFNTGQPGDVQPPTQPNIGYFIGSDGKRRDITANQADALASRVQTVPAPAAAAAASAPTLSRPTVSPTQLARGVAGVQRSEAAATRRDAQSVLNPMSASGELLRRLENSQNSYFNKGSPSARAFAAEAILGQLRAGNAASALRQQQVGQSAQAGAAGEIEVAEGAATRQDAQAGRELTATLRREELDASAPVLQLEGGNTARVGRDGVVRTLVGEDGKPVRGQADVKALDPNEVFKAAAAQRGDIANNPLLDPDAKAAALAEFDAGPLGQALSAALPSSPQGAPASRPTFEQLRAANPNVNEAELRAYFDREYGSTQ